MKQQNKTPTQKIIKRVLLALLALFILFIATIIFMVYWRGSTKDIETEANKFIVPSSWILSHEQIDPPRIVCIHDTPCPYVSRRWTSNQPLSQQQVASIFQSTGWSYYLDDKCNSMDSLNTTNKDTYTCTAHGTTSKYSFQIYFEQMEGTSKKYQIILSMQNK